MKKKLVASILMFVLGLSLCHKSFAWDGYVVEIANYAEDHYNTGDSGGQCVVFVGTVLKAVTGKDLCCGLVNQSKYETALQNTHQAVSVNPCDVERGDIFTVTPPHIGIVSEDVVCNNGKIEKFIYTDSNHNATTSNPLGDELVWEKHSDSNRYYLDNSSLHFWRVGKSKNESPTPTPTPELPDDSPMCVVFNDTLHQVARRSSDNAIVDRYSTDGEYWSEWTYHGGATYGHVGVTVFQNQMFQVTAGTNTQIYTRSSHDGEHWDSWTAFDGATHGNISMAVFQSKLYQATRGTNNRIYTRYSDDGRTWTTWAEHGNGGATYGDVSMLVFQNRLYQAVRGTNTQIYTRSYDGIHWSNWIEDSGSTDGNVMMVVFQNRLYQAIRGKNTYIYTRYYDGERWSAWVRDNGTTAGDVNMAVFQNRLYQVVRGKNNRIYTRFTEDGVIWKTWEVYQGSTYGNITMCVFQDRLYQGTRGTNNKIYTRYTNESTQWTDWITGETSSLTPSRHSIDASGGIAEYVDQAVSIQFPAGATSQTLSISIQEVELMNVPAPAEDIQIIGTVYEFEAINDLGESITTFDTDVTISLSYETDALHEIDASDLSIHYYDEHVGEWITLPSIVQTSNQTVSALTDHFTKFAILAPLPTSQIIVPPVSPIDPDPIEHPSVVPEPTTFLMFGIGILALFGLVTRKLKK